MHVLVLAPYPTRTVPSQRFRFEQYLGPLQEQGIRLEVRSLLDRSTWQLVYASGHYGAKARAVVRGALGRLVDLVRAPQYDAAIVHREAFPFGYPVFERALAARHLPYLFDFDDAVYLADARAPNRLVAPLKFPRKTESNIKHASLVVAGNQYLAAWARAHNRRVKIIPTTIDTELYLPRHGAQKEPVCIGWSGSKTTSPNLRPLWPVLRDLQREYGVRFRFIGDEALSIPDVSTEVLPWQEESEVQELQEIDIGLMPLPATDWACGKCGLKALQYMALEIPTVMSPVGVNVEIAAGGAAVLAGPPEDWHRALAELVVDREKRARIGAEARKRVVDRYSVEANVGAWVDAIRETARPVS